ncbi:PAS domain-containing sensor histidine kinase [Chryseolinea lacunae]|uniref:histidine kinase n=1 Tax=Chryseolinea lacunae TaxID=2801331 RepID=A0ABS1KQN6_9BACT|nr:PAS domain-containing sensor histidine kinase [Chryseolinea lacunae]MBL0740601.1 PAS domain-containing sensor histidine kinase [Chryseolinea lacunae]
MNTILMDDLTRLVNAQTLTNAIGKILSDGVVLVRSHTIASAGKNICDVLGFPEGHFNGLHLSALAGSALSETELATLLQAGFFEGYTVLLQNSSGGVVRFSVSGFHMGLVADVEGLIILTFRNLSEADGVSPKTNGHDAALDDFIYATSHGLRGPLATMKGLLNLMKLPGNNDYGFLMEKMKYYADRLDERLHKLIYYAESDKSGSYTDGGITLEAIKRKFQCMANDSLSALSAPCSETVPDLENGELILALLLNVRSFFIQHGARNSDLKLQAAVTKAGHAFELRAGGIRLTPDQQAKIDLMNFSYAEVLNDPDFTDIYSAKKITLKLRGQLRLQVEQHNVTASIHIPSA